MHSTSTDKGKEYESVEFEGRRFSATCEGLAKILIPENSSSHDASKSQKNGHARDQAVFYNPIQQFNRDLSVLAIKAYGEDALSTRRKSFSKKQHQSRKRDTDAVAPQTSDPCVAHTLDHHHATKNLGPRGAKRKADALEEQAGAATSSAIAQHSGVSGHGEDLSAVTFSRERTEIHTNGENQDLGQATKSNDIRSRDEDGKPLMHARSTKSENATNLSSNGFPHCKNAGPEFRILDALSATGLRALRYAHEIPFVTSVTANDMSIDAIESIERNISYNHLQRQITPSLSDALVHLYSYAAQDPKSPDEKKKKYDVIDLDPYGTAVPFLEAAMHALKDGGLLCVTCTDASIWASTGYPEKTYSLYGGAPARGDIGHEAGLRLILHCIASIAARHGIAIEPLISLSIDFYARVFVRIKKSLAEVKFLAAKTMLLYHCDSGCGAWEAQYLGRQEEHKAKDGKKAHKHSLAQGPSCSQHCKHCGLKTHMAGPMYGGPLHNPDFVAKILGDLPATDRNIYGTHDRIEGMLVTALEESLLEDKEEEEPPLPSTPQHNAVNDSQQAARPVPPADPTKVEKNPFFFIPTSLSRVLHCQAPSEILLKGALRHAGYRVTRSHTRPGSIRTNAPWSFIWEMMREWVRQKRPIKESTIKEGSAGWGIMGRRKKGDTRKEADDVKEHESRGPDIVFDEQLGKDRGKRHLRRYQINPRSYWGPMQRAKG